MKRATMAAKQKHENVFDKKCSKSFKEAVLLSVIHNLLPYQISPLCCFVVVFLLCEWKTTDQILLKITYNDVLKMHCEWHLETWTSKLCVCLPLCLNVHMAILTMLKGFCFWDIAILCYMYRLGLNLNLRTN